MEVFGRLCGAGWSLLQQIGSTSLGCLETGEVSGGVE